MNEPNSNPTPPQQNSNFEASAKEAADKAMALAKGGAANFKKLESLSQIYLGGLTIVFLCTLIFDFISIKFNLPAGLMGEMSKLVPKSSGATAFEAGANGKLVTLAALAGLGIWFWNLRAPKKEDWVPVALAGCAGFSTLMILVLLFRSDTGAQGIGIGSVEIRHTLFGFWLPFAASIAATVAAVRKWKSAS